MEKRLTVREIAAAIDMDFTWYSKIETGANGPSSKHFDAIAATLGIEPDSADYRTLVRLASLARHEIPDVTAADPETAQAVAKLLGAIEQSADSREAFLAFVSKLPDPI